MTLTHSHDDPNSDTRPRRGNTAARSRRFWAAPFIAIITLYRVTLAPLMGGRCRFEPSCSAYALEAYRLRNPIRATWLTARRVLRCHPWGGSGYDPVPLE